MIASEREHLNSLLKDLEVRLSSVRTSDITGWFQSLEEVAREAGLLWVVAEPPPTGQLLGTPDAAKIVLNQANAPGVCVRRTTINPPVGQTRGVLEVRLPASGARLSFGVGYPDFNKEPDSDHICGNFVERLADIADAALLRLTSASGTECLWASTVRDDRAALPSTAISGVIFHQAVNMAKDITSGISLLMDVRNSDNSGGDEREARLIRALGESAEQLLSLLGGIGYAMDTHRPTSLREVVEQAAKLHKLPLTSRHVILEINIAPEVVVDVPSDAALFAIANLIGNATDAIARTGRGGVISIDAETAAEGVFCRVSDNGPGIPEEIRNKLFDKGVTTKTHRGGWGLYLVSRSLREYRGDIELSSPGPDKTTFTMRFPPARQE